MWLRKLCLYFIGILLITPCIAADLEPIVQESDEFNIALANNIHQSLSENIISLSNAIDNFFVEERMDEEGSHSRVVLGFLITTEDAESVHSEYLLKARLHLPKTQNKLRLVVESSMDFEQETAEDNFADDLRQVSEDAEYSTALQFIFTESQFWQISNSAGVRFSSSLNPFYRLRLRRVFLFGEWESRITQSFYWFEQEGFGETTAIDFERKINKHFFFRATSRATIVEEEPGEISANQNFSLFQPLSSKKGLVYSIGADGHLNHPAQASRYYINIRFRHNFYKKWAFYEVVPGVNFYRADAFVPASYILLKLDIVIGKV